MNYLPSDEDSSDVSIIGVSLFGSFAVAAAITSILLLVLLLLLLFKLLLLLLLYV